MNLKRTIVFLLVAVMVLAGCAAPVAAPAGGAAAPAEQTPLRAIFMKQAGYQQSDIEAITAEFEAANPNVNVELEFVEYEALHDKIVTTATSGASTYDVVLVDCIWPAEFAAANFILDVTDRISDDVRADIWPGALESVSYQGKLYGMPWLNDVLYLYYNKDLLAQAGFDAPPTTWTELQEMGLAAKEQGLVDYPFIEYFRQEEGLTIAYAYYLFAHGGDFFNEDGSPAGGAYPVNPNGSVTDIAGICNPAGNVLGLMPHPEDHIDPVQNLGGPAGRLGLRLFEAMIASIG